MQKQMGGRRKRIGYWRIYLNDAERRLDMGMLRRRVGCTHVSAIHPRKIIFGKDRPQRISLDYMHGGCVRRIGAMEPKIQELEFDIAHRPGIVPKEADTLSPLKHQVRIHINWKMIYRCRY